MSESRPFHLAVELDGAGRHPAAWRLPDADAAGLLTAAHWAELVRTAERAGAVFVVLADSVTPPSSAADVVQARLDATGVAALLGPLTSRIGIVPVVPVTYSEPFHVAKAVATVDLVSQGRAGWQVDVAAPAGTGAGDVQAAQFHGRSAARAAAQWTEAADVIEVVRRLWDSWEDDAIVLDAATDRYIDRDRVHDVAFTGTTFSVAGASITPRSPQGQPLVVVRGDVPYALGVAVAGADVIRIAAQDVKEAGALVAQVRAAVAGSGRPARSVKVLLDVETLLGRDEVAARERLVELDHLAGRPYEPSGLHVVAGADRAADALADVVDLTGVDGLVLQPLAHAGDLAVLAEEVSPRLREQGRLVDLPAKAGPEAPRTLRDAFGLDRPLSRYTLAR
ncbi:LLM class flavin-dependent oxidoreductase [Cellulomonas cellasea]|uniref:LLM class flavin-dependent oxidoreductase n=1 Tax=Cellulomonas cellasea TaxID=43670 RepID=UPI0025A4326A|nr:LLM class flavin-dependent oxidoreductase [Cellulomonas cellasea]MDM8084404.1 LLM class flavin-dependent oxidoreductase [Cellulomonas cellasea]